MARIVDLYGLPRSHGVIRHSFSLSQTIGSHLRYESQPQLELPPSADLLINVLSSEQVPSCSPRQREI